MLDDPQLTGDLLLVGLGFARYVDFHCIDHTYSAIAAMMFADLTHAPRLASLHLPGEFETIAPSGSRRVKDVVRSDIRRYAPDVTGGHRCERPVRRTGAQLEQRGDRCNRSTSTSRMFTDPLTGTRRMVGACREPRCLAWWADLDQRNRRELAEHPPPAPPANRGGVLARHLPELDWPAMYTQLDPSWTPPHEEPGWRPPTLTVVFGDDEPSDVDFARPTLTVLPGGWR